MTRLLFSLILFSGLVWSYPGKAEISIEITKGVEIAIPLAVVPFGWEQPHQLTVDVADVIQADLSRSGFFKVLPERDMLTQPSATEQVRFRNWQALGQDYLVIGKVTPAMNKYQVQFQLFDVYKGEQLMGYRMDVALSELRSAAHHISDMVLEKLTGKKGVFNSRIAYVTTHKQRTGKRRYQLKVADADGFQPKTIAESSEPIMSPGWSPDGKQLVYVSFERRRAAIYLQTLASGKREKLTGYKGINGAPAFSPDGKKLALTLSRDGSPDIYVLDLRTRKLQRITRNYAIDTEPSWSPDGSHIIFTSDRGGKPQIYSIPSTGGRATRLTFSGDYNAGAHYSKDGSQVVMVHANRGDYRIALMDVKTGAINVLTGGRLDESPSFPPNDTMILFAARQGGRSVLSAVSVDGSMQQHLVFDQGEIREPAWAPAL